MITVTGKLEDVTGTALCRQVIFESKSTPQAKTAGLVITNSRIKLMSNASDGTFSIDLEAGRYAVTYQTKPRATGFSIELGIELDGTTVGIDQVISDTFAGLPGVAPYMVWNGMRAGHITFVPVSAPVFASVSEVTFSGGHIAAEYYSYAVTFITADGETNKSSEVDHIGSGTSDRAIRVPLTPNVSRVIAQRIYRSVGGLPIYLLAEVGPSVDHYDDWESNADFSARLDSELVPPGYNTTAGIIGSSGKFVPRFVKP